MNGNNFNAANFGGFGQSAINQQFHHGQNPAVAHGFHSPSGDEGISSQYINAHHSKQPQPQMSASVVPAPTPIRPDVPYFDLPAGLMVPLVELEDYDYTPIDPKEIRLPPPVPPCERLLRAVEEFYAPPAHDRPRNSEGWEQLSLYEFFRAKSQAKKDLEEGSPNSSRYSKHSAKRDNRYFSFF
jgi:hypothetical protein